MDGIARRGGITAFAVGAVVALFQQAHADTLQGWFDSKGYKINAARDKLGVEAFRPGPYRVTVLETTDHTFVNPLGWYSGDKLNLLFPLPQAGDQALIEATDEFGFYILSDDGTFFTETSRNADGYDHALVFREPLSQGHIVAFEDLWAGGDADYTDQIILVEGGPPVPCPFLRLPFHAHHQILQGWRYNAPINPGEDPFKHEGVDYDVPMGTEILAAAAGKARFLYQAGEYAYGNHVVVDHENGFYTLYAHLDSVSPRIDSSSWTEVSAGEVIGASGTAAGAPHLHFELSEGGWGRGYRIDPYGIYSVADHYTVQNMRVAERDGKYWWTTIPPAPASAAVAEDFDRALDPDAWLFSGNARHDVTNGWLELTSALGWQTGSAFLTQTVNSARFDASFRLYIGGGSGADGLTFAWVRGPTFLGGSGGSLGFYGGLDGYAVKFDTYSAGAPEPENYVAAVSGTQGFGETGFFYSDTIPEIEDAGWFYVEIKFDNGHMQMWMSNESLGYPLTIVLDGTIVGYVGFDAYFGFTAATGGATNVHAVDNFSLIGSPAAAVQTDYVRAAWAPAHPDHYTTSQRPGAYPIPYIVIHAAQGSYAGTVRWGQMSVQERQAEYDRLGMPYTAVPSVAHYVVASDGRVTQMVRHKDVAFHAGNTDYNNLSIGIEHEGYVDEPSWFTEALYQASADLVRYITELYGIPRDRAHIIGHLEVPGATHTDPGPHWDWDHYMRLVGKIHTPMADLATGELTLKWSSYPGKTYSVYGSSDMLTWELVSDGLSSMGGAVTTWTDPTAPLLWPGLLRRYYRIWEGPIRPQAGARVHRCGNVLPRGLAGHALTKRL